MPAWAERWWHIDVTTAEGSMVGGALRPRRDEIVFATRNDDFNHKPAKLDSAEPRRVLWTLDGAVSATLEETAGGATLTLAHAPDRPLVVTLRPEGDDRAKSANRLHSGEWLRRRLVAGDTVRNDLLRTARLSMRGR